MSDSINNSSRRVGDHALLNKVLDKTRDGGLNPEGITKQVNELVKEATAGFAQVVAKQLSDETGQKKTGPQSQLDPNAPELKEPDKNAVNEALKEGSQRKESQKTGSTSDNKAQKQQDVPEKALMRSQGQNTPEETSMRGQGQMKTQAGREAKDSSALSSDQGGNSAEDAADNNQMTKFISSETKVNQNTGRNEKNQAQQQPKTLQQDAGARSSNKLATDAQSATHVVQGSMAKSLVDEDEKLTDVSSGQASAGSDDTTGSSAGSSVSGKAAMNMFFNMVMETVNQNTIENMMSNINTLLANDLAASEDFQQQYDDVSGMQEDSKQLAQQLKDGQQTLNDLKTASSEADAAAAAARPPDPALEQKANEAAKAVLDQKKVMADLTAKFAENEAKIAGATEKFYQELSAYNATHHNITTGLMQQNLYALNNKGFEMLAVLEMLDQIDKNSLDALNEATRKRKLIQDAEAKEAEKKMAEAIESKRKADAMGCIAKLIAAIVTVVSFVAAIFTGGASLVFAAIAMALLVVDTAMKAAGKTSLSDMFMEKVLQPLMEKLAKALGDVLKKIFGDQPWVDSVSKALAMIITAVAVIALMVAGMRAAGSLLGNVAAPLGKMATQTAVNNINSVAKAVQASGAVLGAASQTGNAVYTAKLEQGLADVRFGQRALQDLIDSIGKDGEQRKALQEVITQMTESLMSVTESKAAAGKAILSKRPIAS